MIRKLRLASGLILFAYVVTHFANHSLGLLSVETMDVALRRIYKAWASHPGTVLLYGAFLVHYALALWALWRRHSLRISPAELTQLVLGFAIPPLLAEHVLKTRVADTFFESDAGYYAPVLLTYWVYRPNLGVLQFVTLVVAWIHACIGLRFWLQLKPWYGKAQPLLFAFALLLPTFATLGFVEAGRQVATLGQDPAWVAGLMERMPPPSPAAQAVIEQYVTWLRLFFVGAILAVLGARLVRQEWYRRRGLVRVTYPDGREVRSLPGLSVLEVSRLAGIPHASVCGGRGRCSTCRVWVEGEPGALPPPAPDEVRVLERIAAPANVRLACQLRPRGDVRVVPLLPATAPAGEGRRPALQGSEREIAILFCDLRAFTHLAEGMLPYDVVFLLNRYFAEMGGAIEAAGGRIDKFIGDGIMALFGIESGADAGCRQALAAAKGMSQRLDRLNHMLARNLEAPLRIGIGIHAGAAVVGEMGYGRNMSVTAVGDAVNTASRLETLTKSHACELVVSEDVIRRAHITLGVPRAEIEILGRRTGLAVYLVASAAGLPDPAGDGASGGADGAARATTEG